eukprot:Nitzschia sp. Nitz4//scaffold200_size39268//1369//2523//NITZ4_007609-RA/size39268-processed-gene-0.10-mRNA-1//-1//CDS//3329541265//975//frame0
MEKYTNDMELVPILINYFPDALTHIDDEGLLPLHRALMSECTEPTLDTIKQLLQKAPETILQATGTGALPIHLACSLKGTSALSIVQHLVKLFPEALQHPDNKGLFPLDYALGISKPNEDIVELLSRLYPSPLARLDGKGRTKLHRLLDRPCDVCTDRMVDILVKACPLPLRFQDWETGLTPLLQACGNDSSVSQLFSLLQAWPEQATVSSLAFLDETSHTSMPSSALACKAATLDRLQAWIGMNPSLLTVVDVEGRTPLHYVAMSSSEQAPELLKYLLRCHDSGKHVQARDHHGRLPIHYAAANPLGHCSSILIEVFPRGLACADKDDRLPWHYAECSRQDDIYDKTLELFPEVDGGTLHLIPEEIRWDFLQVCSTDLVPLDY